MQLFLGLSTIFLVICLAGCRIAVMNIAHTTARCRILLQQQTSIANSSDEAALPKKLTFGCKLPEFQAIDVMNQKPLEFPSLIGSSTILIFCTNQEYQRWSPVLLLQFLQSCWYRIDGKIYVILLDKIRSVTGEIPHKEIIQMDVGVYTTIGNAVDQNLRIVLGLKTTPCIVELDGEAYVRKIGFVRNQDRKRRKSHD